jgi:protein O-mannosyl-transferase
MRPRDRALGALFLVVLTLLVYWPAMHAAFIWDDDEYVTKNPTLQAPDGLKDIWLRPGATPQYYPLVHTTFWIEHHFWGLRPLGYHLVNILLHALAAATLWILLRQLGAPGAWLIAAIFALHPLQVESVAWVTERKNVLSGLLYFTSILAYLHGRVPVRADHVPRRLWYTLSLFLFLCALWSKTVTATLPIAVIILLWWKWGRIKRRSLLVLAPFGAAGVLLGSMTIWMEKTHVRALGPDWDLSLLQRTFIAGHAFWFYLYKLICPTRLTFIYGRWSVDPAAWWQILFPLAGLALFAVLWLWRRRVGRAPLAAALFYGITLFPALGFFNTFPMRYSFVADHFQYLAGLGPIALVAGGLTALVDRWSKRLGGSASGQSRGRSVISFLFPAAIVLLLAPMTWHRAQAYRDPEVLWLNTLQRNPQAWMARHNLGRYYEEHGRVDEAIDQYKRAMLIRPDLDSPAFNLGNIYANLGKVPEAVRSYETALGNNPRLVEAHINLGNLLYRTGDASGAIRHYEAAVELAPSYATAHRNLAFALAGHGDVPPAAEHYREVLRLDPDDFETMNRLAWILAATPSAGRPDEAIALGEQACRGTSYQNPIYLATLAAAAASQGQFDRASVTLERAITLARAAGKSALAERWQATLLFYENGSIPTTQ